MASQVQICNFALSRLASDRIISLSDQTKAAKECNAIYDIVAEITMSTGPWPSCTKRTTLAQSSTTPDFGFTYQYQLPTDPKCLKVLAINECKLGDYAYAIENGYLLTDLTSVSIQYIMRLTNTEDYDVFLMQAVIEALTAELSYRFTGQSSISKDLTERAEKKIMDLLNQAGVQGSSSDLPSDTFVDIRR